MDSPRFSLRTTLASVTAIAAGLGCIAWVRTSPYVTFESGAIASIASGGLIAGGLFVLFGRPWLGALCGMVLQTALLAYLIFQPTG